MKIGIHHRENSFSELAIPYCREHNIPHKIVDCYRSDIIDQLADCDALIWHFCQACPTDIVVAKQILYAVELSGKKVFPDTRTAFYFDDKLGQKYLFEALGVPTVQTDAFYDREKALAWAETATFPKVFKMRGGAGSANVKLIKTKQQARKVIRQAFGKGFSQYHPWSNLKDRVRQYRAGQADLLNVAKGVARFLRYPEFARVMGKDRGYVYFQEFLPHNTFDIRVTVVGNRAYAVKRMAREGDFRASGSGYNRYAREEFPEHVIERAFQVNAKIQAQSLAIDFLFKGDEPLVTEVSYGTCLSIFQGCPGYWDANLNWHEGTVNPVEWIMEDMLEHADEVSSNWV